MSLLIRLIYFYDSEIALPVRDCPRTDLMYFYRGPYRGSSMLLMCSKLVRESCWSHRKLNNELSALMHYCTDAQKLGGMSAGELVYKVCVHRACKFQVTWLTFTKSSLLSTLAAEGRHRDISVCTTYIARRLERPEHATAASTGGQYKVIDGRRTSQRIVLRNTCTIVPNRSTIHTRVVNDDIVQVRVPMDTK